MARNTKVDENFKTPIHASGVTGVSFVGGKVKIFPTNLTIFLNN